MPHHGVSWRMMACGAVLALSAAGFVAVPAASAQNIMRSPNVNTEIADAPHSAW